MENIDPVMETAAEKMAKACKAGKWDRCQALVPSLALEDALAARYWQLRLDDRRLRRPLVDEWRALLADCCGTNAPYGFDVFANYLDALVKFGDVASVSRLWPLYRSEYARPSPTLAVNGVAALLIDAGRYEECLKFLDDTEALQPDELSRKTSQLRCFSYRYLCRQALGRLNKSATENPISDGLAEALAAIELPIMRQPVVEAFHACWRAIRASARRILSDIRFNHGQAEALRHTVHRALVGKHPFSLIRIGDAESYGLRDLAPEAYAGLGKEPDIAWWNKRLDEPKRATLGVGFLESLRTADAIGFPGTLRLVLSLEPGSEGKLSTKERRVIVLCEAVRKLLETGGIRQNILWAEEFCSISLAEPEYMASLFAAARNVVLVSCFDIPDGHLFKHPKLTHIAVPPQERVLGFCPNRFNGALLPDMIEEIAASVQAQCGPGTLLLVSAGYAGKLLIGVGKQAGAVAIDFGSALDKMLGHHTRDFGFHTQLGCP